MRFGINLDSFVDRGSDEAIIKSMNKSGLTQRQVTVNGKHGQYQAMKWVKASEDQKTKQPQVHKESHKGNKSGKKQFNPIGKGFHYMPLGKDGNPANGGKSFTLKEVSDYYRCNSRVREKYHSFNSFIMKNYYVSDGKSETLDMYRNPDGSYKPSRQKLHDEIVKSMVDEASLPPKGEKPVCFLYGGGSASGKGHIIKEVVQPQFEDNGLHYSVVDSDEIKKLIPEYDNFKKESIESAAMRVHNESSDIANQAIDEMIKAGKCFSFDGTMKNYDKYDGLIDKLKKNGYTVNIVGVTIPVDEAIKRSDKRAEESGRKVPESIIRGSHGGFSLTFPKLIDKVDNICLYDNSQPEGQPATLIYDTSGVKNEEMYNSFLQKGQDYINYKKEKANKKSGGK